MMISIFKRVRDHNLASYDSLYIQLKDPSGKLNFILASALHVIRWNLLNITIVFSSFFPPYGLGEVLPVAYTQPSVEDEGLDELPMDDDFTPISNVSKGKHKAVDD